MNERQKKMLNFLLETTTNAGGGWITIAMFAGMIALMYFLMIRPQKKREKEDAAMRDALAVGDEVTTIGGIIGKVISIKDETFVLETTKDRTKIRFLRGAIRSVDVKIADIAAAQAAEKAEKEAPAEEAPAETEEK
jgi:preprotein translocase subunit YajC